MRKPIETSLRARLIGEGAVIVLSILLAFWIDAWSDSRQAKAEELEILASVDYEADRNAASLDSILAWHTRDLERIDLFFRSSPEALLALPTDSVQPWLYSIVVPLTFDAELAAATVLLDSPRLASERGREVRRRVADWVRSLEDAAEEKAAVRSLAYEVSGLMARASAPAAVAGLDLVFNVAARRGPAILSQLRADDEFVAAVMNKAQLQTIYLDELTSAAEILDSLTITLRGVR